MNSGKNLPNEGGRYLWTSEIPFACKKVVGSSDTSLPATIEGKREVMLKVNALICGQNKMRIAFTFDDEPDTVYLYSSIDHLAAFMACVTEIEVVVFEKRPFDLKACLDHLRVLVGMNEGDFMVAAIRTDWQSFIYGNQFDNFQVRDAFVDILRYAQTRFPEDFFHTEDNVSLRATDYTPMKAAEIVLDFYFDLVEPLTDVDERIVSHPDRFVAFVNGFVLYS